MIRSFIIASLVGALAAVALVVGAVQAVADPDWQSDSVEWKSAPGVPNVRQGPMVQPPCWDEDGGGQRACIWDARHRGNGMGKSVLIRHGGTDRAVVRDLTHRQAHHAIDRWVDRNCYYVPADNAFQCPTGWKFTEQPADYNSQVN